ncbi:MAG: hypothetical protein M3021_03220 [Actinomycetota bacterium]|nr:hypothetical protein [Actinomycetota bacterium]
MKKITASLLLAAVVALTTGFAATSAATAAGQDSAPGSSVAVGWWPNSAQQVN